ncbi:MAG TPA: bacitracin resistance protein [Microbacterium sp.]|uniref:bacitracin resistance protein n=1 Tax=Microbacterium sp. TaxID=51671 RepID=UPI002C6C1DDE|nr:bacitracin resistance protein [Microbacterium sp.]HWI29980.1 bacitracin resistance protein [Microbacterium sp.]
MTEQTIDAAPPRRTPTWLVATIAGGFGLFYAYAVWNALSFLITFASAGPLTGLGWFVLIFAVAFPVIAFAAAFALGFRRPAHHFLLIMLTGLSLVAVFWLNVIAYLLGGPSVVG